MTTEEKLYWCRLYWDTIDIAPENKPHYGWRVTIQAIKAGVVIEVSEYTVEEAVGKLFKETLKLAFEGDHYVG